MLKTVIFDFDGVIANTYELNLRICREQGRPELTEEIFKDHHNGNVFKEPKIDFNEEQASDFYARYYDAASPEYLFPIMNGLEELAKTYELYIVTSNSEKIIYKFMNLGGLDKLFRQVLGVESGKSKIDKLNTVLEENALKAEECVFISDTTGDIKEGKKVGMHTLAVTWGYHDEERLLKAEPDKIIQDFDELLLAVHGFDQVEDLGLL